jgi:3-hydroxyisobutyrate dehydrogenase-like beta-hydroxyacid dehydrogenase
MTGTGNGVSDVPAGQVAEPSADGHEAAAGSWLIVGHGTVGSVLSSRVLDAGGRVWIRDDEPRLGLPTESDLTPVTAMDRLSPSYVAICVPAQATAVVSGYLRSRVEGHPLIYDWTSASPSAKIGNAALMADTWIDVALLDSLDRAVDRPLLAISGARGPEAAAVLRRLGFDVAVAGDCVGQAAGVKLTRSLFMKSLEALVVEFRAVAAGFDPGGAAWLSIERSLGPVFAEFADVLVTSDAAHAGRRTQELRQALSLAADQGYSTVVAEAASEVLARLAALWSAHRPTAGAPVPELLAEAQRVFRR